MNVINLKMYHTHLNQIYRDNIKAEMNQIYTEKIVFLALENAENNL